MALTYNDTNGLLVIPGAPATWQVAPSSSGTSTTGVLVLVGEADDGPSYLDEDIVASAGFGVNSKAAVVAKFGAGRLVDAYVNACAPSKDASVTGAPTRVYLVKTNQGTKASATLTGAYSVLDAVSAGESGNLLNLAIVSADGGNKRTLTFARQYDNISKSYTIGNNVVLRFGAQATVPCNVTISPTTLTTATPVAASGTATLVNVVGADYASGTITCGNVVAGHTVTVNTHTYTAIAVGPPGAGEFVTAGIDTATTATNLAAAITLAEVGAPTVTAVANVSDVEITAVARGVAGNAFAFTEVGGTMTLDPVGGTLTGGVDGDIITINGQAFTAVVSGAGENEFLIGATDADDATNLMGAINTTTSALIDGIVTASITAPTNVVRITADTAGAEGNLITFTETSTTITLAPLTGFLAGGVWPVSTVASLNLTLANFRTLGDLAAYIDSQLGWSCSVVSAFTQLTPSALDQGTNDAHDAGGLEVVAIKKDAYEFVQAVTSSGIAEVRTAPTTGLPAVQNIWFSGGLRGATTDAKVTAALVQAERVSANFVVPLFSQDASADTDTDAASTYTIAGINAAISAHVSKCSQFKNKKPRQGFASLADDFVSQKEAAQVLGAYRISMSFLEVLALDADGSLVWFQPWMESVVAAAMQASAFYKPIFNKSINLYGARSCEDDFVVESTDDVEEAILAGLLVVAPRSVDGAMSFVSDQTTYGVDDNFVLNSIQAIYCSDTIAMTVSQKMEVAFVGQNFADVSAAVALSFLKSVFMELKRLKLLAGSDDAPGGYKSAQVSITPPAMLVSAEVKPATGLYFIPIKFLLTQATSTAQE